MQDKVTEQAIEIARMAKKVATIIQNGATIPGYLDYKDDKIAIHYSSVTGLVMVYILKGGGGDLVLDVNLRRNTVESYRPGKWEDYIASKLYPQAMQAIESARKRKEDYLNNRFKPIDESDIFG